MTPLSVQPIFFKTPPNKKVLIESIAFWRSSDQKNLPSCSSAVLETTMNKFIELKRRRGRKMIAWALKKISAHKVDYLSTLHSQPVDRKVSTQQVAAIMI